MIKLPWGPRVQLRGGLKLKPRQICKYLWSSLKISLGLSNILYEKLF